MIHILRRLCAWRHGLNVGILEQQAAFATKVKSRESTVKEIVSLKAELIKQVKTSIRKGIDAVLDERDHRLREDAKKLHQELKALEEQKREKLKAERQARQVEAARQKKEAAERQAEYLHKKEEQKRLLNEQARLQRERGRLAIQEEQEALRKERRERFETAKLLVSRTSGGARSTSPSA